MRWFASTPLALRFAGGFPCCCGPVGSGSSAAGGRANCFCCGPGYYAHRAPAGGPLEWRLSIGSITGSCLGSPCSPASGTHFAAYLAGCTWITPRFTLCSAADCFAWVLSIGNYPACDPNPVDRDAIRLQLANVCSGVELLRYENPCETRIGLPFEPLCDPPVHLTCDGPNTLEPAAGLGICFGPSTIAVEPVY